MRPMLQTKTLRGPGFFKSAFRADKQASKSQLVSVLLLACSVLPNHRHWWITILDTQATFSDGAPSVGFWHVQSAKSMRQGTSTCGTATAIHFARALGYCMMLLPPIHAPQSPHAFCRLRRSPGLCYMGKQRDALAQSKGRL